MNLSMFHGWKLMHIESSSVYKCLESGEQSDSGQVGDNGILLKQAVEGFLMKCYRNKLFIQKGTSFVIHSVCMM